MIEKSDIKQCIFYLSIWIIALTIIFTIVFMTSHGNDNYSHINTSVWGQYGDIIGGVVGTMVALIGALLLYETLTQQQLIYSRQQIETRFYELVKLHRDNVIEMKSKGKTGRSVFIDIKDEFHELYDIVDGWKTLNNPKYEIKDKAVIQISYLICFFGVNNSSTNYLKSEIKNIFSNDNLSIEFIDEIIEPLVNAHKNQKKNNSNKKTEKRRYLKYDGHQSHLGHYYRHLYQSANYINNQPSNLLNYAKKYEYIKTLRAQLSTHEQALLCYNSISPLGEPWELSLKINDENKKLITKYDLIKNIPEGFTIKIDPRDYYPDVFYEYDDHCSDNKYKLINIYK